MTRYLSLSAVVVLSGLLVITGCAFNPLSSKDPTDEPEVTISAESVGDVAYQSIEEASATPELLSLENPAPEDFLAQPALPDVAVATRQSLGKKSAAASFSLDTIGDTIRIALTTTGLLQNNYDTIEAVFDATVFDDIDGNESLIRLYGATVHTNGIVESYRIEDRDGDHIINGTATTPQRASVQLTTTYTQDIIGHQSGETVTARFEAGAGSDNDFDTDDDNNLHSASWVKLLEDDTLAYALFEDADGDGIISENGPGTTLVSFFEKDNPFKPFVDYGKAVMTVERDEQGKERTVSFYAEEKLVTGRLNRVRVTDENGDTALSIGEMAHVQFATNSPAVADSEITAQVLYVIDPGENFGDVTDNTLHEITCAKSYRFGHLDSLNFHCTFEPPVPNGEEPTTGTFELNAMFRNGKSASLEGTFDAGERVINGTYTGPEGNETEVELRSGDAG